MNKKRLLSLAMAVIIVMNLIASLPFMSVFAAEGPSLGFKATASSENVKPGDVIDVTVSMTNYKNVKQGIAGLQFLVDIDSEYFEYVENSGKSLITSSDGSGEISYNLYQKGVVFLYTQNNTANELTREAQDLCSFKLKVLNTALIDESIVLSLSNIVTSDTAIPSLDIPTTVISEPTVNYLVQKPVISLNDQANVKNYIDNVMVSSNKGSMSIQKGQEAPISVQPGQRYQATQDGAYAVTAIDAAGNTTTETFSINRTIDRIAMKSEPTKTVYTVGNDLDLVGGKITVHYSNGITKDVDITSAMISGYDKTQIKTQTITVAYEGKSTTFNVTVKDKVATSIAIKDAPSKLVYTEGTAFDPAGGTITVSYNNGTSEVKNITTALCSSVDMNQIGEQTVTVTYDHCSTSFKITINQKQPASIAMKSNPSKLTYVEETPFETEGGVITVTYDNGATKDLLLTKEMCSAVDMNTIGSQTVTVTYGNKKTSFAITVEKKQLVNISMSKNPDKMIYKVGKDLDVAGGQVSSNYNNGTQDSVALTSAMCSGYDQNKTGDQEITVTHMGMKTSFTVTVQEKELTGISMQTKPKTAYIEGNAFDPTNGVITLNFDNDTTQTIALTEAMCSGFDMNQIGTQTVTVAYSGKTTSFDINVKEKSVTIIELVKKPDVLTYIEGTSFAPAGGQIKAKYDNGTSSVVDITSAMCSGYNMNQVGNQVVTVTYGGKSTQFDITVNQKQLTAISRVSEPTTLTYLANDKLSVAGGQIEAVHTNYDALSQIEKNAVTNSTKLSEAVKKIYALVFPAFEKIFYDGKVIVSAAEGTLAHNDTVEVKMDGISSEFQNALKTKFGEKTKMISYIDFSIKNMDDSEIFANGMVFIKIKLDDPYQDAKNLTIVAIAKDGSMTELTTAVENGYATCMTNVSGRFALVQKPEKEVDPEPESSTPSASNSSSQSQKGSSPKTGDPTGVFILWITLLAVSAGAIVILRRKQQSLSY